MWFQSQDARVEGLVGPFINRWVPSSTPEARQESSQQKGDPQFLAASTHSEGKYTFFNNKFPSVGSVSLMGT